jgi:hypothetical protein|tara:strand:+ start:547 stop:702 length:156 start_codon:yes stop_codon:yes gene_type:complete
VRRREWSDGGSNGRPAVDFWERSFELRKTGLFDFNGESTQEFTRQEFAYKR